MTILLNPNPLADQRLKRLRAVLVWGQDILLSERAPAAWPNDETLAQAFAIRDEVRESLGVNNYLAIAWEISMVCGYPAIQGVLVSEADEAIAHHAWNVLPGGFILDVGRDRFGLLDTPIVPKDVAFGLSAYRPEWSQAQNPERSAPTGWSGQCWSGVSDMVTLENRRQEKRDAWWCTSLEMCENLQSFRRLMQSYRRGATSEHWTDISSPRAPMRFPSIMA